MIEHAVACPCRQESSTCISSAEYILQAQRKSKGTAGPPEKALKSSSSSVVTFQSLKVLLRKGAMGRSLDLCQSVCMCIF